MVRQAYTVEQLMHLRTSPLVQKPEALPPIDQWNEQTPQEREPGQRKNQRAQNGRSTDESGPMGNFGAQRPMMQSRQGRQTGDDVVLGPPKTSFASSRNYRAGDEDGYQKDEAGEYMREGMGRNRGYNEEDGGRRRGFGAEEREQDGWSSPRRSKPFDNRAGERERPFDRNTRTQQLRGEETGRRNGYGSREDNRWNRDTEEKRPLRNLDRGTSWRDRDPQPEKSYGRDAPYEKEPEWLDGPEVDDEPVARTAAEFEKWKAKMKGQKAPEQDAGLAHEEAAEAPRALPAFFADSSFGTWGDAKKPEAPVQKEPAPATPAAGKKASRFASMFAPKEEPRPVMPEPPTQTPSADQEAFQRMLSKLRVNAGPQDGAGLAALFPAGGPAQASGGVSEHRASPNPLIQSILTGKSDSRPGSAQPGPQERPPHMRQQSGPQGPKRDVSTPEALAQQQGERKTTPALSKDSEFLLNLIQMKPVSRPPPPPDPNFQLFLDQPNRPPQGPAQGPNQGPNPGQGAPHPRQQMPSGAMPSSPEQNFPRPGPEGAPNQRGPQPPPGFFDSPQRLPPGFGPNGPPPPDFFRHDGQGPPPGFLPPHLQGMPRGMPPPPGMFSNMPPPPHMQQGQGFAPSGFPPGFMPPPGFQGPPGMQRPMGMAGEARPPQNGQQRR